MEFSEKQPDIILASKSPRRRYLLDQAGLVFSIIPSHIDEKAIAFSKPEPYVKTLAEKKAEKISSQYKMSWVIGADTIVLIDDMILNKPKSKAEAGRMLNRLNGRIHTVLTGFSIQCKEKMVSYSDVVKTRVQFKNLTSDEIKWYIGTKEPMDKAGAYAIQGLGTCLVKSVFGSYTNVVGLPVCEVMDFLKKARVIEHSSK